MRFRIYGSVTAVEYLWEETHRVEVENGEFKAVLGKKSTIPSSDEGSHYIGITINGDELSPRHLITGGLGEDIGEGRLVKGKAHIDLDPLFLETATIYDILPTILDYFGVEAES